MICINSALAIEYLILYAIITILVFSFIFDSNDKSYIKVAFWPITFITWPFRAIYNRLDNLAREIYDIHVELVEVRKTALRFENEFRHHESKPKHTPGRK